MSDSPSSYSIAPQQTAATADVLSPPQPMVLPQLAADFTRGLWKENGVFKQMLGLCSTLAVTTSVANGVAMGLATTAVMVGSNFCVSSVRRLIPQNVRIPCFIVIIAVFVTVVDLCMDAYAHALHKTLGLFIPLIVVNCFVLGRADAFAAKRPLPRAVADGLGVGIGFTLALAALGSVRELAGAGSLFGMHLLGPSYPPVVLLILPPGAFLVLGLMMATINHFSAGGKD